MNDCERDEGQSRRSFLQDGSLYLLGAGLSLSQIPHVLADETKRKVRLGLVTDLHYADKPPAGSRHYRETLAKLEEAATQFQKDQPDHIVGLGDLIDAADSVETERGYLKRINKDFALPVQNPLHNRSKESAERVQRESSGSFEFFDPTRCANHSCFHDAVRRFRRHARRFG